MNIQMKWYYRLGFLLLLFIVLFIFVKLQALWVPVLEVLVTLLIPFSVAAFITYLLHPIVEGLHQRGLHRGVAILIIYILFFGGLGFAFYKGIPAMIIQLRDLAENAPYFAAQYKDMINNIMDQTETWPAGIHQRIEDGINRMEAWLDGVLAGAMTFLMDIVNSILTIAVIPFIAFYMLKDFDAMKKAAWYLTPRQWRQPGTQFLHEVDKSLGSYIRGQLLVCLVIGVLSTIFFWIAGIKYALLLGAIVGITNVIPYFGPIIGAIPAVIIAATMSVKMVVISLVIVFSLQFLEGNILSPLIVGKSLHMHPLMIMFALLAGGEIGGILGLILAVPVLVVLRAALIHAKDHIILERKKQRQT
ncbi:AI-2E family transporter [Mesobacillus subterraneus]|uniref:AI-2E family transporter n=1 Tax=Mesobacillus subterraneus TaxID=285983 RepID=A0A3R9FTF7_9BACI|nr:AI-2E family transporter [Mesobacillus subterraneus]RSD24106.1 AI-2E family transporter [Mesobacillus subterraneus]